MRLRIAIVILAAAAFAACGPARADDDAAPVKKGFHWKDLASAGSSNPEPVTVAGVRGLDKSKDTGDAGARDYAALAKLETVTITPEELKQFRTEGKLP